MASIEFGFEEHSMLRAAYVKNSFKIGKEENSFGKARKYLFNIIWWR